MAELYSYLTNTVILASPLTPESAIYRLKRICQMSHVFLLSTPSRLLEGWCEEIEVIVPS